MTDQQSPSRWDPIATVVVLILCCAWIGLVSWATCMRSAVDESSESVVTAMRAIAIGVALAAATVVASRVFAVGRSMRTGTGEVISAVLCAVCATAVMAANTVSLRDALSLWLTLVGVHFVVRPVSRLVGVTLLGVACGCSPLAAGALVTIWMLCETRAGKIAGVLGAVLIGLFVIGAARWPAADGFSNDVARIGPSFLWTLAAEWLDLVMVVLVFALLAVSQNIYGPPDDDSTTTPDTLPVRTAAVWLAMNGIIAVAAPRLLVTHGLVLIAPAVLLVPAGWRVLRALPFARTAWTLSLFSSACYLLVALLAWTPIRKSVELVMQAIWAT